MSVRAQRWRGWVAIALSIATLGAIAVIAVRQRAVVVDALATAASAPWWLVLLTLALPIANWWLVSVSFWVMNGRYAPTGLGETGALIGSAWLLNFLPLRPGMIGRLAYHKRFNGIPVSASVRVLIELTLISGVAMLLIAGVAVMGARLGLSPTVWWVVAASPMLALGAIALVMRRLGVASWRWWAAGSMRLGDVLVWVARYAVIFAMIGADLAFGEAVLLAVVSQLVLLIPISGNGLGLREAAVATLAALAPGLVGMDGDAGTPESRAAVAASADLAHRGLEIALAVPIGLLCSAWIGRRVTRSGGPASVPSGA